VAVRELVPSIDRQLLLVEAVSHLIALNRSLVPPPGRAVSLPRCPVAQIPDPLWLPDHASG
jgi:hypothetical protein